MMEGMEAFNTCLFQMERRTVALEGERQQLINEVTVLRAQVGQNRHRPGCQQGRYPPSMNVIRKRQTTTTDIQAGSVVQAEVTHGCSRLSIPIAVRRSGTVSRPDLESHS